MNATRTERLGPSEKPWTVRSSVPLGPVMVSTLSSKDLLFGESDFQPSVEMLQSSVTMSASQPPSPPSPHFRRLPRTPIIVTTVVVVIVIVVLALWLSGTITRSSSGGSSRTYAVTFHQTNLQRGGVWNVTLGGTTNSSTGPSIEFLEPDGIYNYSVSSPNYSWDTIRPSTGTVTVSGAAVSVSIAFSMPIGAEFAFGPPSQVSSSSFCESSSPGYCYAVPIASASSAVTTANVTFAVHSGGGQNVALTGTVVLVSIGGASLATFSFVSNSWGSGVIATFSSTDSLVLNTASASVSGDSLVAVGTGSLQGTTYVALP